MFVGYLTTFNFLKAKYCNDMKKNQNSELRTQNFIQVS